MRFADNIYLSNSIKKPKKIMRKLSLGKKLVNTHVIVLSFSGKIEIYHNVVLLSSYYKNKDLFVIGIASSKDECFELIEQMTSFALEKYGNPDARILFDDSFSDIGNISKEDN